MNAKGCSDEYPRVPTRFYQPHSLSGFLGSRNRCKTRASDLLWKHREAHQEGLFAHERRLLGLFSTILSGDLSNTHNCGRQGGTLRRYGRSKQRRSDCSLISLALDGAGFPRHSEILPGNVSEPGMLQGELRRCSPAWATGCRPDRCRRQSPPRPA